MAMKDSDGSYSGLGIRQFVGAAATATIAGASTQLTATFASPAVPAGTVVQRGKWYLAIYSLPTTCVIGAIDIEMTDGTNFEYCASIPATTTATARQALSYCGEFFTPLLNATGAQLVVATGVTGIRATVKVASGTQTGTIDLRVSGGV